MADASVFETGKLTDVWTTVGKDVNGNLRFRRANFDMLLWASNGVPETFFLPLGTDRYAAPEVVLKDSWQVGQEFGYYSGDSLVLDPSAGDGQSDTLQSLHTCGFV